MSYKTIMAAVDFSPHSERAVRQAAMLAGMLKADLFLLHVVEVPTYPVLEDTAVSGLPGMWDVEMTQTLMDAAKKQLQQMARRYDVDESQCDVIVGVAKVDIVEHAEQMNVDLIVMGRHGEGFLESLIGSVTDSVMHHARCDVLAGALDVEEEKKGEGGHEA